MACCPAATGLASAAAGQLGGPALDSAVRYLRHDNGKVDDCLETNTGVRADAYWSLDDELDWWRVDLNAVFARSRGRRRRRPVFLGWRPWPSPPSASVPGASRGGIHTEFLV